MNIWSQIGGKIVPEQNDSLLLSRLFRGYRGNFPAATVESAPMYAWTDGAATLGSQPARIKKNIIIL